MKLILALLLAFGIGALCRFFDIPLPAPPTLIGVALILAITFGYIAADKMIAARRGGGGNNNPAATASVKSDD